MGEENLDVVAVIASRHAFQRTGKVGVILAEPCIVGSNDMEPGAIDGQGSVLVDQEVDRGVFEPLDDGRCMRIVIVIPQASVNAQRRGQPA